jgi:FkbM family methyltransferase
MRRFDLIKKIIPNSLKDFIKNKISVENEYNVYQKTSFSQEGEDLILERLFEGRNNGFFIDVGAHHPVRFSNTYSFYRKGWRGINIDAMPGSMSEFNKVRSEDSNIEQAIGSELCEKTFYVFDEPALNTFDQNEADSILKSSNYRLIKSVNLEIKPLSQILDSQDVPDKIDFLSIDVEGLDLEVLKGNNWKKYQPEVILIELLQFDLNNAGNHETVIYLESKGYSLFAKTFNTVFFKRN